MSERDYLLLQLHAPMAAFGGVVVDNFGGSRRFPARSMLTGLIANALGWRRQDWDKLQNLQARVRYAVRLEHPQDGRQWCDFQTAEIGAADKHWTTSGSRAQRAGGAKTYSGPHLRYRDYMHDLRAIVSLTLSESNTTPTLNECEAALLFPERPIFIGRKACLPSAPLVIKTVSSESALEALRFVPPQSTRNPADRFTCLWMPGEGMEQSLCDGVIREYEWCDERDWRNSQHVGNRTVVEASLSAEWFQGSA